VLESDRWYKILLILLEIQLFVFAFWLFWHGHRIKSGMEVKRTPDEGGPERNSRIKGGESERN